jgi:hypothetical protein
LLNAFINKNTFSPHQRLHKWWYGLQLACQVYLIYNAVETECSINQIHYGLIGPLGRLSLAALRGIVWEFDCFYKLFLRQ